MTIPDSSLEYSSDSEEELEIVEYPIDSDYSDSDFEASEDSCSSFDEDDHLFWSNLLGSLE